MTQALSLWAVSSPSVAGTSTYTVVLVRTGPDLHTWLRSPDTNPSTMMASGVVLGDIDKKVHLGNFPSCEFCMGHSATSLRWTTVVLVPGCGRVPPRCSCLSCASLVRCPLDPEVSCTEAQTALHQMLARESPHQ